MFADVGDWTLHGFHVSFLLIIFRICILTVEGGSQMAQIGGKEQGGMEQHFVFA